jgi:hypothetical protein
MKITLRAGSVTLLTWATLSILWLTFSHPDMTQQRLLLTFWREYLIVFAVYCGAAGLEILRKRWE